MSYRCPRCGCGGQDDPGLCYSCLCEDYLKGKRDKYGSSLFTEVKNERLEELLEIEKKYLRLIGKLKKGAK